MFSPKRIMVPTDYSEHSDKALSEAISVAKVFKAKVHVLHVVTNQIQQCVTDYCMDYKTYEKIINGAMEASKEKMRNQISKVYDGTDVEIVYEVVHGNPYEEINKFQKANAIDLVVLSRHGKTGILKHLMGGVTEKVLHTSECPVLLVAD